MKNISIRWHSRAGLGAITAANALTEIIGKHTDIHAQSFPDFGSEKRGAPVAAYNRFSDKKIDENHLVEEPNIAILLDTTLINSTELDYSDIIKNVSEHLIINTSQERTKFSEKFINKSIWYIDASKISKQEIGRNLPNIPILGGLIKILNIIDIKIFSIYLEQFLEKVFPPKIVEGNIKALLSGYNNIKKAS
jgi:pyruvate ferredoxin oxidoreductase gamma subunit